MSSTAHLKLNVRDFYHLLEMWHLKFVASFGFETVDGIIVGVPDDDGNDDDDGDTNNNDDDSMLLLRVCVGLISDAKSPSCDPVAFVFDCLSSNMTLFIRKRNTSLNEPAGGSERVTSETGKSVADPREAEPIEGNATDADDVKVGTFESDETGADGVNILSLDCFGQVFLEYRGWYTLRCERLVL